MVVPEVAPAPSVVERVVEAVLPEVVPLAGLLPFHVADLDAAADALLTRLDDLGVEVSGEWLTPEGWAWVTGAVLVAGGAAYAARVHRHRGRSAAAPPGVDSALAHWEGRRADRRA